MGTVGYIVTIVSLVLVVAFAATFWSGSTNEDVTGYVVGSSIQCSDSDGGSNIWERGTRVTHTAWETHTAVDFCNPITEEVMEHFCSSHFDAVTERSFACPRGYSCLEGACVADYKRK